MMRPVRYVMQSMLELQIQGTRTAANAKLFTQPQGNSLRCVGVSPSTQHSMKP
jgi:hypothetical protein